MKHIKRKLKIDLPQNQSAFLWGARKTGKTTFLKQNFAESVYIDLLNTDLFIRYLKVPSTFREHILAESANRLRHPIIIDEVQKVPLLFDEVHYLIEEKNLSIFWT